MIYTTKEVAEILKLNIETIKRMARDGRIKAVKLGKQWRIPEEEVERLKKGE